MEKTIKIMIAAHKKYDMPSDALYLPVHVGAALSSEDFGYQRDDCGENISKKNPTFCELTALYWAWKNLDSDYIGLAHYRRHFCGHKDKNWIDSTLSYDECEKLLSRANIIVPKKRKYYIESLSDHYAHTLSDSHLPLAKDTIAMYAPQYLPYVDTVYKRTWGYMFNMAILSKEDLANYCEFLFPVLFAMEREISTAELSGFHARLFGRVSEILFNVWLAYQMDVNGKTIVECPLVSPEKTNWIKKGGAFLMAKFFGKKYEKSF